MVDNYNIIISTIVSETVEKIPIGEKDYRKCSFNVFYFAVTAYKEHTNI